MCSRYFVEEEMLMDIRPADQAEVLVWSEGEICREIQRWGFPSFLDKQLVINARSESAMEKKMFYDSVENRRVVIPASGFYEWNQYKEKSTFTGKGQQTLYMAGIYNIFENEKRFVILTTAANDSMAPVHDRMPLILDKDDIIPWLTDEERTEEFLHKVPCQLERKTEFEQMTLF